MTSRIYGIPVLVSGMRSHSDEMEDIGRWGAFGNRRDSSPTKRNHPQRVHASAGLLTTVLAFGPAQGRILFRKNLMSKNVRMMFDFRQQIIELHMPAPTTVRDELAFGVLHANAAGASIYLFLLKISK